MKITEAIINKLKEIIDGGLCHGPGTMLGKGTFCVQQAVTAATKEGHDDRPECVNSTVRALGIQMNDKLGHNTLKLARSRILRRFAVAELGSDTLNENECQQRVVEKWNKQYPKNFIYSWGDITTHKIENVAEVIVQTLIDMKSPGTEYLYMCGDTRPGDPQPSDTTREMHQVEKQISESIENRLKAPKQLGWRTSAHGQKGKIKPGHFAQ